MLREMAKQKSIFIVLIVERRIKMTVYPHLYLSLRTSSVEQKYF